MTDWFTHWFGKEYLELYPHRNEIEARASIGMIRGTLGHDPAPARILDLACGTGRHSRVLREWAWTVGLDLSMTLLEVARTEDGLAPYVRGDMRGLPFANASFGLVVNLFTSFGYFTSDEQHAEVVAEVARVTRAGGMFVLDFLNADFVRRTLVPYDVRVVEGRRVEQRRVISADGHYVEKTIAADESDRTYEERVRLFSPEELRSMLEQKGFVIRRQDGDYDGRAWTADSPRVIMFAERV
jgi:SAM-dependent methyltransferase